MKALLYSSGQEPREFLLNTEHAPETIVLPVITPVELSLIETSHQLADSPLPTRRFLRWLGCSPKDEVQIYDEDVPSAPKIGG